jgi:hypothetical protein
MASMLQLSPPILVETPLGAGEAIFLIDYGIHQNSCWVVALLKDGIVKHFDSNDIRMTPNYTYHINIEKSKAKLNERVSYNGIRH